MDVNTLLQSANATLLVVACDRHYWQVYFDTTRVIREALGEAGFPDALSAPH